MRGGCSEHDCTCPATGLPATVTVGPAERPAHSGVIPEPFRIRGSITGSEVAYWVGGESFASAERFQPAPGEEATFTVVESSIGGMTGTGSSLGVVALHREDGSEMARPFLIGDHGLFRSSGLRPGSYFLRFRLADWWSTHWYQGADSLAQATPIEMFEWRDHVARRLRLVAGQR